MGENQNLLEMLKRLQEQQERMQKELNELKQKQEEQKKEQKKEEKGEEEQKEDPAAKIMQVYGKPKTVLLRLGQNNAYYVVLDIVKEYMWDNNVSSVELVLNESVLKLIRFKRVVNYELIERKNVDGTAVVKLLIHTKKHTYEVMTALIKA